MALARRTSSRAIARRHNSRYRRRGLGDSSCSHTSRAVRGGIGALLGGVLGAMIGGGVAVAYATAKADITAPIETISRARSMALVGTGITVLGVVGGLAIGAAKPEC